MPITLVVPTSFKIGCIEFSPYFFTVSETGRDVAEQYVETPVGSLALHKFVKFTEVNTEFSEIPQNDSSEYPFKYIMEVYMNDYIVLGIPRSWSQLHHVTIGVMTGINDVLPPDDDDGKYSISLNIFLKKEGAWKVMKNVIGFDFDTNPGEHTIWLTDDLHTDLLEKLKNGFGNESTSKRASLLRSFKHIFQD